MLSKLVHRFGRKSPPDLWRFGLDVQEVMSARISRAISGNLSAAEARRMVSEKQSALVRAQFACMQALFNGEPAKARRAVFEIFHRAVRSNRKRLRKRRRR